MIVVIKIYGCDRSKPICVVRSWIIWTVVVAVGTLISGCTVFAERVAEVPDPIEITVPEDGRKVVLFNLSGSSPAEARDSLISVLDEFDFDVESLEADEFQISS